MRAVTDDAGTALLLKTILYAVPKKPASRFAPSLQLVHSATADEAADGTAYCAAYDTQVAARGKPDLFSLVGAIAAAASSAMKGSSLMLPGNLYVDRRNGKHTLVVGEENPPRSKVPIISHHIIWNARGLSPAWNFTILPADNAPSGCIVDGANSAVVPGAYNCQSLLPHPSVVRFVSKGNRKLKNAGDEDAAAGWLSSVSPSGGSEEDVALFKQLVEMSGTEVQFS